mgnify:CR=1 FL=1
MKGYRTLGLNLLLAIAPVLQATGAADLGLTGNTAVIYGAIISVLNIGLRFITTGPVGTRQ